MVYQLYKYTPSFAAGIAFAFLFGLGTIFHSWQLIRTKSWFMIPFWVGCLFETIGYVARAKAHSSPNSMNIYIIQVLMILLGPALFAASIYMILGRTIVRLQGEKYSPIKKRWLTKLFVGGDVISFLVQSGGGGMMASKTASAIKNGSHLVMIGLVIQLVSFGLFIVVAVTFHLRFRRFEGRKSRRDGDERSGSSWRSYETLLYSLYGVGLLIIVRSVFRLIEYAAGSDSYLVAHESFLYIFDALLMFMVVNIMSVFHPAKFLTLGLLYEGSAQRIQEEDQSVLVLHETAGGKQ